MATEWQPTHRITIDWTARPVYVMATEDGPAYTYGEWEHGLPADIEIVDGQWLFQGRPFTCEVERLPEDARVLVCKQKNCGHTWPPRYPNRLPLECPACKSRNWNK